MVTSSPRRYQAGLLLAVTLTGMAVLILEITAARILTPYFGNSIYTFASVISTILAALALGYYAGGRLADRNPSDRLFYGLILAAGVTVLLLQLLRLSLLPALAHRLSMIDGPLVVSLLLFLLPALLLGTLSPFAIKLLHRRFGDAGVGRAAGLVFFFSTVGSIAGSLLAGFVLIPWLGVGRILVGVSGGLLLLGAFGLLIYARAQRIAVGAVLLVGLLAAGASTRLEPGPGVGVQLRFEGLYEQIVVRDYTWRGRPARLLLQDRNISGGLFLDDGRMTFDYTKYFDLYRLYTPRLERALAIGGGAYTVPRAILRDVPWAIVDVAEIEPALLPVAQRYFDLPDSPRLHNHVIDGRRFLRDSPHRYDLIFVDVYRAFASVPMQFTTREFFALARRRLAADGIIVVNVYGSLGDELRPLLEAVAVTMRSELPRVRVIASDDPHGERLQNFIFVGHNASPGDAADRLRAAAGTEFAYPELRSVGAREVLRAAEVGPEALLLSDDYAPVERFAARLLRRYVADWSK